MLGATKDIRTPEFRAQLDKFKAFSVEEGSHWRGPICTTYVLKTTDWEHLKYVKGREAYINDTPYPLEKDRTSLFPEWYFYLLRNFSRHSPFHSFYCSETREKFYDFLVGTDTEKDLVMTAMEQEFLSAFKAGLGKSLDDLFKNQILSRSIVESTIIHQLTEMAWWPTLIVRQNQLIAMAILGDIMPYVFFLMAYDCSENYIWMNIAGTILKHCFRKKHFRIINEKVKMLREEKMPLVTRIRKFVNYMESFGLLPKPKVPRAKPNRYPKRENETKAETEDFSFKRRKTDPIGIETSFENQKQDENLNRRLNRNRTRNLNRSQNWNQNRNQNLNLNRNQNRNPNQNWIRNEKMNQVQSQKADIHNRPKDHPKIESQAENQAKNQAKNPNSGTSEDISSAITLQKSTNTLNERQETDFCSSLKKPINTLSQNIVTTIIATSNNGNTDLSTRIKENNPPI